MTPEIRCARSSWSCSAISGSPAPRAARCRPRALSPESRAAAASLRNKSEYDACTELHAIERTV